MNRIRGAIKVNIMLLACDLKYHYILIQSYYHLFSFTKVEISGSSFFSTHWSEHFFVFESRQIMFSLLVCAMNLDLEFSRLRTCSLSKFTKIYEFRKTACLSWKGLSLLLGHWWSTWTLVLKILRFPVLTLYNP